LLVGTELFCSSGNWPPAPPRSMFVAAAKSTVVQATLTQSPEYGRWIRPPTPEQAANQQWNDDWSTCFSRVWFHSNRIERTSIQGFAAPQNLRTSTHASGLIAHRASQPRRVRFLILREANLCQGLKYYLHNKLNISYSMDPMSSTQFGIPYNYIREIHKVNFLDMKVVHIYCYISTI
jgi:hypothetical protein